MQQIRCGLCGRQTLVDPQSPGTCPSCGFPLSAPADATAPNPVPAAAGAVDANEAGVPDAASPAEPVAAAASGEPLTLGPIVGDPAPLGAPAAPPQQAAAPAGAAFVVGPVVGDPGPAEPAQVFAPASPATDMPMLPAQTLPLEATSPELIPPAVAETAEAVMPAPAEAVEAAAYVPPVPVTHTTWQDPSDASDAGIPVPTRAADDIYVAQDPTPELAALVAEEPEAPAPEPEAPELSVQPPRFDASDAAITAVAEPSAVVEDIYITRMAEPVAAPETAPIAAQVEPAPAVMEPTIIAPVATEAAVAAAAEQVTPEQVTPEQVAPEQVTMPAAEVPLESLAVAETTVAEPAAAIVASEAAAEPAALPATQPPLADAYAPPPSPPTPEPPAPYPGTAASPAPLPGPYPYTPQPAQPPATAPYPYAAGPTAPMGQMGQMPPMSPMSQMPPPPPRKSRVGLIVIGIVAAVVVLALLLAGLALVFLARPTNTISGGSASSPITPTAAQLAPTSSIPTGFTPYTGTDGSFGLNVPSDWTQNTASTANNNSNVIDFTAPDNTGRLRVAVVSGTVGKEGQTFEDLLFGVVLQNGKVSNKQGPTTVSQAGETWTQESADVSNDTITLHVVAEVATHGGNTYTVLYLAAPNNFSTLDSQDFQPMFTSFQFLK